MTAKQKRWFDWVYQRGCLVPGCSNPPSLHHVNGGRSEVKTVQTDFPRWELIKLREQYKGQARVDPVEKKYKV